MGPAVKWLCAFAAISAVCVFCILFVDRPVAGWAAGHFGFPRPAVLNYPWLTLLAMLAILAVAARAVQGQGLSQVAQSLVLSGFALAWGVCTTEFLLKPLFGRQPPEGWLIHGTYTFSWFLPTDNSSFPSGHAVQMAAVATVFWRTFPGWRWLCLGLPLPFSAAFVLGNWHYVSDVIAGLFIGVTAGLIVQALWNNAGTRPAQ
jgi:membrane-associated phospholipid phosphatase